MPPLFEVHLCDELGGASPYFQEMVRAESAQDALLCVASPVAVEKVDRVGRTEEWWRVADVKGAPRFARVLPLIG